MFGLEVILGNFSFSRFSPIMISSVVATAISRHYLGVGYENHGPGALFPNWNGSSWSSWYS